VRFIVRGQLAARVFIELGPITTLNPSNRYISRGHIMNLEIACSTSCHGKEGRWVGEENNLK
jgi:hypothetical protein